MLAGSAQLTGLTEWRADTSAALKTTLKPHSHHGPTVIHFSFGLKIYRITVFSLIYLRNSIL